MLLGDRANARFFELFFWSCGVFLREGFRSRINQIGFAASCIIAAILVYIMSEAGLSFLVGVPIGVLILSCLVASYVFLGGWFIAFAADRLAAKGRIDQAIAAHSVLIDFQPMNHMAPAWRGHYLMLTRRYDEAAADFRASVRLNPSFARHDLQLARCQAIQGGVPDALETLDRALTVEPRCTWNWQTRGALLLSMGSFEDAIRDFDKAVEVAGDSVDAACFLDPAGAFDSSQYARIAARSIAGQSEIALRQLEQWQSDRGIEVDKVLLRGMATRSWRPADLPELPPEIDPSSIDQVALAVMRGLWPIETAELDRVSDGTVGSCFARGAFHYELGEIALLMGREDQAVARFNRAMREGAPFSICYGLAKARLAQIGQSLAQSATRRSPLSRGVS